MTAHYHIHPSIGIARLGNSPHGYYLEPDAVGARPIEANPDGSPMTDAGGYVRVNRFKDDQGRIKRQAAWFRLFRGDEHGSDVEVTLDDPEIKSITWTAHVANKKAAWYNFTELEGNLLFGEDNSYQARKVPLRNADVTDDRQKLIIDPGPRRLTGPDQTAPFSADTIPADYRFGSFPDKPKYGDQITTLGEMRTDPQGRLLVLGGFGHSGGDEDITSFAGANTWHDDIADGQVTAVITLANGDTVTAKAWVIVGSPKYAPELVNISTLADVMLDVAVRNFDLAPKIYADGSFQDDYIAYYDRDIAPIIETPGDYRWVANVPSMLAFASPKFDPRDGSAENAANRQAYAELFRFPGTTGDFSNGQTGQLFAGNGIEGVAEGYGAPMLPLNSGNNSVTNVLLQKFLTLTETQFFFLKQWAEGKFTNDPAPDPAYGLNPLDIASVGNCVGLPNCPGIEVTWSCWNPPIYDGALSLKRAHDEAYYNAHGLSPSADETRPDSPGCEPGDLTKRMAIPWQADFFQCSVQYINFTDPLVNKTGEGIPLPPTYYAYWWPPQSPWQVITGDVTVASQAASGLPAGQQALYSRGINTFSQMIAAWSYLGFVVNVVDGPSRGLFPYFVETERNHDRFQVAAVAVGQVENVITGANTNFMPVWFLKPEALGSHRNTKAARAIPRAGGPRL